MWDEYAASIGTTANNLTQQQKIQAEVNGIMQETKFQTEDAATYANTFAGRTAQLSTAFLNLKTAVGKVIAPIASTFIPVIVTAMNAVTKFFNKIQQLLSVFGFKWQDVVTKNVSGMGDAASSTASSIGDIGDSATSTAKKIKRALGGMDELNILSFNKDSAKGNKGSSGLGDVSSSMSGSSGMFDNTITEDPISPQIKKIADKIKTYLKPLKKIKFDNLVKSFDKLKDSLKPFKKKLFEGLEWLWFEILVPIAKWTVEDAVPAYIDAIAGALDLYNGAMDFAKPYLQYFWEEFLQPIAKWTGGVIVDTLSWIGDKLSIIGDWLSKHAPDISTVRKELEPFTNIFKKLGEYLGAVYDRLKPTIKLFTGNMKSVWENTLKPLLKFVFEQIWDSLKNAAGVIGGILDVLTGIVSLDFDKVKKGIDGIWTSIKKQFIDTIDNWKEFGKNFIDGLAKGISETFGNVKTWVKEAIFDPVVKGFKSLFGINSPSTVFTEFGKDIIRGLGNGLIAMKDWVVGKWNTVKSWFSEIKAKLSAYLATKKEEVTKWWNNVKSWWGTKTLSIKNKFETAKSTVSGWWSNVKSWWGDRTLSIKAKISDVTSSLKNWINTNFIDKVNSKLPSWLGKIPRLAQGGWVAANNPQLALIGDNKREGEIVTPESKIYDQAYKAVKDAGGTGKQQLEITIYHKYEDGRTIIQKVNQAQIDAGEVLLLT